MIFVRRKGPQLAPGPEIPDEAEEAALGEDAALLRNQEMSI